MSRDGVARNAEAYRKRADKYENVHGEIFNEVEQARVCATLAGAADAIQSGGVRALDFGCGSGNLTRHMLRLGLDVTCADLSPEFLRLVTRRYGVPTIELIDGAISCVPEAAFDLIGLYSVLHHIPDYLAAVRALVAKLRPGGILIIDHERSDNSWRPSPELLQFRAERYQRRPQRVWNPDHNHWQHLLRAAVVPSRHLARYRRIYRASAEGDIHVYEDDHIEWVAVTATLAAAGAEVVERANYLQFVDGYSETVWRRARDHCADTTYLIARRPI